MTLSANQFWNIQVTSAITKFLNTENISSSKRIKFLYNVILCLNEQPTLNFGTIHAWDVSGGAGTYIQSPYSTTCHVIKCVLI